MKKKIFSVMIIILLAFLVIGMIPVRATDFSSMKSTADNFISKGEKEGAGKAIDPNEPVKGLMPIASILLGAGIAVAIVTGLIMGVKYMLSGADEKAKLKEKLIWWVISVAVMFGAVAITNIVINVMNSIV